MSKQLSLYEKLSNGAGRDVWRDKAKTYRSTYKVPFKNIVILSGWNTRTIFDHIEELAEDLSINGQREPLEGVMTPEGKFQLTDGERRYRAIEMLRKRGEKWEEVEVIPVPKSLAPVDMMVRMLSSGIQKSIYKDVEVANGLLRLKEDFNLSNEKIAERLGNKSRQWVDNMIKLAKQPEEIKKQVAEGKIKKTDVIIPPKEKVTDLTDGIIKPIPQPGLPASLTRDNEKADHGSGSGQENGTSVSGKDALQGVNFDKEVNEQEAMINRMAKNLNKLESLGKGLNEQAQGDFDKYVSWLRTDIEALKEFYGKFKNKNVTA